MGFRVYMQERSLQPDWRWSELQCNPHVYQLEDDKTDLCKTHVMRNRQLRKKMYMAWKLQTVLLQRRSYSSCTLCVIWPHRVRKERSVWACWCWGGAPRGRGCIPKCWQWPSLRREVDRNTRMFSMGIWSCLIQAQTKNMVHRRTNRFQIPFSF